jgi:hypothetical protein
VDKTTKGGNFIKMFMKIKPTDAYELILAAKSRFYTAYEYIIMMPNILT